MERGGEATDSVCTLNCSAVVDALPQFLSGAEEGRTFLANAYRLASARISARPRGADFYGKNAEASQLNTPAVRQRPRDLLKHRRHDAFHVTVVKMRIALREAPHQFGFDHPPAPKAARQTRLTPKLLAKIA